MIVGAVRPSLPSSSLVTFIKRARDVSEPPSPILNLQFSNVAHGAGMWPSPQTFGSEAPAGPGAAGPGGPSRLGGAAAADADASAPAAGRVCTRDFARAASPKGGEARLVAAAARDIHGVPGDIVGEDAATTDVAGELVSPGGAPDGDALLLSASTSEASTILEIPGGWKSIMPTRLLRRSVAAASAFWTSTSSSRKSACTVKAAD